MENKRSAPTAATVKGAKTNLQAQFTPDSRKTQDPYIPLFADLWDCSLEILNYCDGNFIAAKRRISHVSRCIPGGRRVKRLLRKSLRRFSYYQVTRNLRAPVNMLKGGSQV